MKRKSTALLTSSILTLCFLIVLSGCDKNDDTPAVADEMYNINATMSGSQEVPANTTTGTGTTTGTYNATKNLLAYNVTWSGLTGTATVGHFHSPALAGANALPLIYFNLISSGGSGTASGNITLTDAQEVDLLAGKFYANIHTAANSGGEIRGQVTATK